MRKNFKKNHAQWLSLMLSAAMIATTPGLPFGLSTPENHGVSLCKMNSAAAAKTTAGSYTVKADSRTKKALSAAKTVSTETETAGSYAAGETSYNDEECQAYYTFIPNGEKATLTSYVPDNPVGDIVMPDYVTDGTSRYKITKINSNCLSDPSGNITSITLPMYTTSCKDSWYNASNCQTLLLKEGALEVPEQLGGNIENSTVTTVVLPDTVKTIGQQAFYKMSLLSAIVTPEEWQEHQETGTPLSTEVNLPSITSISGIRAFDNCTSLVKITMDHLTVVPNSTFRKCSSLTEISLKSATDFGTGCFQRCSLLTSISCPQLKTADACFDSCTSLSELVIPKTFTKFLGSTMNSESIDVINYSITSKNNTVEKRCIPHVIVEDGTQKLSPGEFYMSDASIDLPASITELGSNCFWDYWGKELVLPPNLEVIGSYALKVNTDKCTIKAPAGSATAALLDSKNIGYESVDPADYDQYHYSVTLSAGTEEEADVSEKYTAGTTVTIPANPFDDQNGSREFAGWSDGTTTYQPGEMITMPFHSLTLTVQWNHYYSIECTYDNKTGAIAFRDDNGLALDPKKIPAGTNVNITFTPRNKYVLCHVYVGETKVLTPDNAYRIIDISSNMSLSAAFKKYNTITGEDPFQLTLDSDDGTLLNYTALEDGVITYNNLSPELMGMYEEDAAYYLYGIQAGSGQLEVKSSETENYAATSKTVTVNIVEAEASQSPSVEPSQSPSVEPSETPAAGSSMKPTAEPSAVPSVVPSIVPSVVPSPEPSVVPSMKPSAIPSMKPSAVPSMEPSAVPSLEPSVVPSLEPSVVPSMKPSVVPSLEPSTVPSMKPSAVPSLEPSAVPSMEPSVVPSMKPSAVPSVPPTAEPSIEPSANPQETQKPHVSQQPQETQKPGASQQPQETQKPGASQQPQETKKPGASQQPQETKKPAASQQPQTTTTPNTTQTPSVTKQPQTTKDPTKIAQAAYKNNTTITNVTTNTKITSIEKEAYANCKKLKSVVIGKNVKRIRAKAFYNCKSLKKIVIKSKKLQSIGKDAFKGISAKAVIIVPASKFKLYKKMLKKSGLAKTVKIKSHNHQ